jgi:transcription initiation factor TFIID subunit 12
VTEGLDSLDYVPTGPKKDISAEAGGKRTAKDLVATINQGVTIDPEVEDLLLEMADEFIDSVTDFACRLAKHRGSDTLDVRDIQLHLERNHNIRVPGFSAEEARFTASQSYLGATNHTTKVPKGEKNMSVRAARLHALKYGK